MTKNKVKSINLKVLCIVPSLPQDLNPVAIQSVLKQTFPVDMIVILPRKVYGETVPAKVSKVLNEGLSHIKLEGFDYILRVDGDTVLPSNFLEENLKDKPDLCGGAGYAMLIKVSTFQHVMKGKFHPESDDSYTSYKFMKEGFKVVKHHVQPILLRKSGRHHGVRYFYNRGKAMYRLGYEPLHVLASFRWELWNVFTAFGYLVALLMHEKKFDVSSFVWRKQVQRLLRLTKISKHV